MYREVSRLIMYGNLGQDEILMRLSDIFKEIEEDKSVHTKKLMCGLFMTRFTAFWIWRQNTDLITIYGSVTLPICLRQMKIRLA